MDKFFHLAHLVIGDVAKVSPIGKHWRRNPLAFSLLPR